MLIDVVSPQPSARFALRPSFRSISPRPEPAAFGHRVAEYLRPDREHPIAVQTLRKAGLAVTRLRCDTGLSEISTPILSERAFIVILQLRPLPRHDLWFNSRKIEIGDYPERAVSILDLEQSPSAYLPDPFDCLQFHVSRTMLDEVADEHGALRISDLSWPHGAIDTITHHLGLTILPALERPDQANQLFLDFAASALNAHFAQAFGRMQSAHAPARGGLAPWQERRAKDLIDSRLEGDISLGEIATECRLSRSHFARLFKITTGSSPHEWLLKRRIDSAKHLLLESETAISEIALECGFADQSHLTRVFSKLVGATPGVWRRAAKS
jgi:AraC-like DNA-binding protein